MILKKEMDVSGHYEEISTKTVDEKSRVTIGNLVHESQRVKIYKNKKDGTILLVPLIEIPENEAWLYKNKKAITMLQKGIEEAAQGKTSKLDVDSLGE